MATHRNPYPADKDWRAAVEALVVPQPGREANTPPLLKWNALPAWQKDNQYILNHYRPASYSYSGSMQSIFYLHNESVNIHSHLLGSFLFLCLSFSVYAFREYPVSSSDIAAFGCFFLGAVICLGMSATYHTISNHSPSVNKFSNQLDYVGIVALITGSFVPSVYYGFFCEPGLQRLYWAMASIQAVHSSPNAHYWRALDSFYRHVLHSSLCQSQIPNTEMATIQSRNVCCNGPISYLPSHTRIDVIWLCVDGPAYRPDMAGDSGHALRRWRGIICSGYSAASLCINAIFDY